MIQPTRLGFTIGDVNGIGPEVLIKALAAPELRDGCSAVVIGNSRLIAAYLQALPIGTARVNGSALEVGGTPFPIVQIDSDAELSIGRVDPGAGTLAGDAIESAVRMAMAGDLDAVVTMPISKAGLTGGGRRFPGHTEMIASLTGGQPLMILMTEGLRVALVTIHHPLYDVSRLVTTSLVEQRIEQLESSLRFDFAISRPRIAVLALNPHAGEDGAIGKEEIRYIRPAVERLRSMGMEISGPHPADGFFARFRPDAQDGVLAMYHDQGLIPLKLLARSGGVNFTASLPIVRTSPDHGTAYDIAGKGIADERSVVEAAVAAIAIVGNRRRSR